MIYMNLNIEELTKALNKCEGCRVSLVLSGSAKFTGEVAHVAHNYVGLRTANSYAIIRLDLIHIIESNDNESKKALDHFMSH